MTKRKRTRKILKSKQKRQGLPLLDTPEKTSLTALKMAVRRLIKNPIFRLVGKTFAAVGMVSAFFGFFYQISNAFPEPEIQNSTAQVDDPFVVRFSLHNSSPIFTMSDIRMSCILDRVQLDEHLSMVGLPIDDGTVATLRPDKTAEYSCPYYKAVDDPVPILQAAVKISATFKTLGIERTIESEPFNWNNISRQWEKGEIIN